MRWSGSPTRISSTISGRISLTRRFFGRAQRSFLRAAATSRTSSIPALDTAYNAWQSAKDEDALAAASKQAQTVFADQLPFIPIVTPTNLWAHYKTVHGWLPTQPNLYPFYQDVYIANS